jgi:hypothetical protein
VTSGGKLFTWGRGEGGQLGLEPELLNAIWAGSGSEDTVVVAPTLVEKERVSFRSVSCGEAHTVVTASDGRAFSFGAGDFGQLGRPLAAMGSDEDGGTADSTETVSNWVPGEIRFSGAAEGSNGLFRAWKIRCGGAFTLGLLSPSSAATRSSSSTSLAQHNTPLTPALDFAQSSPACSSSDSGSGGNDELSRNANKEDGGANGAQHNSRLSGTSSANSTTIAN